MNKNLIKSQFIVYITSGSHRKVCIGISDEMSIYRISFTKKFSRLVYFEKFNDRKKAINKKRLLDKSDYQKIIKIVSEKNPEWLDIYYTISGETGYKLKYSLTK